MVAITLDWKTIQALNEYKKSHKHITDIDHAIIDAICKAEVVYAMDKSL